MFKEELFLVTGFQNDGILVERPDAPGQLHAADQINGYVMPLLAGGIEEGILNILLRRLGFHLPISFVQVRCCRQCHWGRAIDGSLFRAGPYNTASDAAFQPSGKNSPWSDLPLAARRLQS